MNKQTWSKQMNEIRHSYAERKLKQKAWDAVIQKWKESGLLLKAFCEQQQIKEADLKYWSYLLYNTSSIKVLQGLTNKKEMATKFIPIAISSSPIQRHTSEAEQNDLIIEKSEDDHIELIIEKSYCLRLRKNFDEQMLLRLIQILRK